MCDCRHTIILRVVQLTDAMEVNAGAVVLQFVVDGDDDGVTPVGFNDGSEHLTVDRKSNAFNAIRGNCGVRDVEVVVHGTAGCGSEFVVVSSDISTAEW